MDELSIARAAVARGLMNERQLQEAREIAAGGRSLLSILFDLGYLRPDDLEDLAVPRALQSPPVAKPPSRILWFILGAVPSFLFAVFFFGAVRPPDRGSVRYENEMLRAQLDYAKRKEADLERQHTIERERMLGLIRRQPQPLPQPPQTAMVDHVRVVQLCMQVVIDPAEMPSLRDSALHKAYEAIRGSSDRHTPAMRLAGAQAAELLGQLGAARSDYEAALQENPALFDAELGLARIDLRNGEIEPAMARLTRASQLQPANPLVHYWKGRAHLAQGLVEAARKHFDEALAIDPALAREVRKHLKSE
jgi:hypothetical protein